MTNQTVPAIGRHSRALKLLLCLQSGRGFNACQLADHLHVSRRTILRDIKLIREAGIDVYYDDERGYRLLPINKPFKSPDIQDGDLANVLFAAHMSVLHGVPGMAHSIRESTIKFLSSCPDPVRNTVNRLLDCCSVNVDESESSSRVSEIVQLFIDAIQQHKQVRIVTDDHAESGPTHTKLAPYRIEATTGQWEVVGRSSIHRAVRRFQIQHIERAEITDDFYDTPTRFRPHNHAQAS